MKQHRVPRKSTFKRTLWSKAGLLAISLAVITSITLASIGRSDMTATIGSIALTVTLLVVTLYTHYTGIYAREAAFPSVSFWVDSPASFKFQFWIENHSKVPVRCWCKLNPSYDGTSLRLPGFYDGERFFEVLPHQRVHGAAYDIAAFFAPEHLELWNQIIRQRNKGLFPRMHLRIEFWYEAPDLAFESSTITHRYYYDFKLDRLVLDY